MRFANEYYEKLWQDRYQKNGETFEEQLIRVSTFIASAEKEEDREKYQKQFYDVMDKGLFFPAGRTMSNAAIGKRLTLNNCFTSPIVPDDMAGIFEKVKLGAVTHKAGGGIGYNFSNLSPSGRKTNNDAVASGAVSFMDVFNAQTATVQQGSRRGANMGIMSIYHPDIIDFVEAKSKDANKLNYFNLSVIVDDAFMLAVKNDTEIEQHFPIYDDRGNKTKREDWIPEFTKKVRAVELWDIIMHMAYDNGEPGIFFEDTMNRMNPANYLENIVCTNPCAEYLAGTIKIPTENPSDYGGACNLGSLFLHKFVIHPFTEGAGIDWKKLKKTIQTAVRMLDDIIDVNKFPDKIYENYQKNMRTIGIGVTGFADMLAMLNMKYNSNKAYEFTKNLFDFITQWEYVTSIDLAKEKGAFPFCDKEKHADGMYCKYMLPFDICESIKRFGIRNAKIQAVAPTGTISMVYGNNCSSGIEPIFSLSYDRKIRIGGQEDSDTQTITMQDYAYGLWLENHDKDAPSPFVTALEMSVDDHVRMLSIIAKYTDMSVSKTINVPTEYPFEDVKEIYMECWQLGCKGCTIFRPNEIRQGVLIAPTNKETKNEESVNVNSLPRGFILDTSDDLIGYKTKITNGCGKFHLQLFFDEFTGEPYETFIAMGKGGGCERNLEFISKLISLCLRAGVPLDEIVETAKHIRPCKSFTERTARRGDTSQGTSCPSAIGWALERLEKKINEAVEFESPKENENDEKESSETESVTIDNAKKEMLSKCPFCGEMAYSNTGGCGVCLNCGRNKCEH